MLIRVTDAGIRHDWRRMIDEHYRRPERRLSGSNFPIAPSVSLPMTADHSTTPQLNLDTMICLPDHAVTGMGELLWTVLILGTLPGLTSTTDDYANPMRLQISP